MRNRFQTSIQLLLLLVALLSLTTALGSINAPGVENLPLQSTDWPWWRGPQRDGHALTQKAPTAWSENQNIIWKAPLPGRGHGSPSIVGQRVFIATADEVEQTQWVLCLDRTTGKRIWQTQIHDGGWQGRIHERNTQASSTVASDGERVFCSFMHDAKIWISALDLNGRILWQTEASDFDSHWGYSASPVIYGELVIVASDHKSGGNLSAFDRKTGKPAWRRDRPDIQNYASPAIYHIAGRDQLILPGCDLLASYDPSSGNEIWSTPATTRETVGTVVVDGPRVYASGGYPKNETVCLLADGSNTIVWNSPIRIYAPSMLAHDGHIYTMSDKGIAHCWNASSGKLLWREKVGGDFSASPVLVDDLLYVSSEQGNTVIFRANPERFELVAENKLGDETWASPVICDQRIYLRVAHKASEETRSEFLYCIGE